MTKEWFFVLNATLIAGVIFLFFDNNTVAGLSWVSLTSALVMIVFIIFWGRKARSMQGNRTMRVTAINSHRAYIATFTTFVLIGVMGIEVLVRTEGGLWGESVLKIFHFSFVLITVVSFLATRFYVTGIADPRRHKTFAYFFLTSYLLVYSSGTILLFEKYPFVQ